MKKYIILLAVVLGCNAESTKAPRAEHFEVTVGKPSDIYGITAAHYNKMHDRFKALLEELREEKFDVDAKLHRDTMLLQEELEKENPRVLVVKEKATERILGFMTYAQKDQIIDLGHWIASSYTCSSMLFDALESHAIQESAHSVQTTMIQALNGHPFLEERGYVKGDRDERFVEERYFYVKKLLP